MMKMKKSILIIMTLILIVLPMMSIPTKAASVGTVSNLQAQTKGSTVYFTWNSVANSDGYDVYVNTAGKGYEYIGSVSDPVAPVIGFKDDVSYTAKVCAYQMTSSGRKELGNFSNEVKINKVLQLVSIDKVTGLTARQNGGTVTLNWNKVNNATGYQVFVDIPNWGYVNLGEVEGINYANITGCENGRTYGFKIRAYRRISSGAIEYSNEYSNEQRITIKTNQYDNEQGSSVTQPARVTNLSVTNITESTANISWSKAQDADAYEIYVAKSNGRFEYKTTVSNNSATISNLDENTTYGVKVVSLRTVNNKTVVGEESDAKWFTTSQKKVQVGTPTNLRITVDGNSAVLNWSNANNADGYEIYMKTGNGSYQYKGTVYRNSSTMSNLNYDTTYYAKVVAFKLVNGKREYGNDSTAVRFTTEVDKTVEQVKNLTASVNKNAISINWSKVTNADGYNIYISRNNSYNYEYYTSTSARSATIANLDYNTTYYIKVYAYRYINGRRVESTQYAMVRATTQTKTTTSSNTNNTQSYSSVPQVKNVTANVQGNTAYLKWNAVSGAVYYEVSFTIPWLGEVAKLTAYTNSKEIDGITNKQDGYTARVRAYKWVNGKLVPGEYSDIVEFKAR